MTRPADTPVVIAGAGPVGLTLALARHGVRSVVLERKTELDTHSRATLIIPRSLEIFSALGVLEQVLTQGQVNPAIDILRPGDNRRPLLSFDFASQRHLTAVPLAIAIPQDRTERILLEAVRTTGLVDIRFGTPFAHFTPRADAVIVNDTLPAQILVGADGAHSAVRDQLGWPLEGTTYPTRAFLADVRVSAEADVRGGWPTDPAADSFTIAVRFASAVWRLIESAIPDTVHDVELPARARTATERIFGAGSWRDTLWTSAYRKHERRVHRFHEGRVVLAGDAAHLNSPAGGQGLNAGLQDAFSLAWRLAGIIDSPLDADVLLQSYSEERVRSFDADVRPLTGAIERMETLPVWARRTGFKTLGVLRATPLPRLVASKLAMLDPTLTPSACCRGPSRSDGGCPTCLWLPGGICTSSSARRAWRSSDEGSSCLTPCKACRAQRYPTRFPDASAAMTCSSSAPTTSLPTPGPPARSTEGTQARDRAMTTAAADDARVHQDRKR